MMDKIRSCINRYGWPALLTCLLGCQDGPDDNLIAVEAFVQEQVEERLANYRRILSQQCWEAVIQEAGVIADSILINEARRRRDSLGKPPRPIKPEKPELKKLQDSLTLDPILPDTISGD